MALAITLTHLGMARLDADDPSGARSALIDALELSRDIDHREKTRAPLQRDTHSSAGLVWALEALAALAVATADHEKGALLLGAAEGVRRSIGAATWAPDRQTHERTELALRAALGDDGFRTKFSEGMRMSPEDAATLAAALR